MMRVYAAVADHVSAIRFMEDSIDFAKHTPGSEMWGTLLDIAIQKGLLLKQSKELREYVMMRNPLSKGDQKKLKQYLKDLKQAVEKAHAGIQMVLHQNRDLLLKIGAKEKE